MYGIDRPMTKEERLEQTIQYLEGVQREIARANAYTLQEAMRGIQGITTEPHRAMHHAAFAYEIIGDAIEVLKDVQAQNRVEQEKRPDQDREGG